MTINTNLIMTDKLMNNLYNYIISTHKSNKKVDLSPYFHRGMTNYISPNNTKYNIQLKKNCLPYEKIFDDMFNFLIKNNNNAFQIKTFLVHKVLIRGAIQLLFDFDDFCKKIKLKYIQVGGNLLGFIRNNGPLPWDDDVDVGIIVPNKWSQSYSKKVQFFKNNKKEKILKSKYYNKKEVEENGELKLLLNKDSDNTIMGYHIGNLNLEDGNGWWTLNYSKKQYIKMVQDCVPFINFDGTFISSKKDVLKYKNKLWTNFKTYDMPHLDIFPMTLTNQKYLNYRDSGWQKKKPMLYDGKFILKPFLNKKLPLLKNWRRYINWEFCKEAIYSAKIYAHSSFALKNIVDYRDPMVNKVIQNIFEMYDLFNLKGRTNNKKKKIYKTKKNR